MTMEPDTITGAVESAAKLAKVQLSPSDWRRLVLFSTAVVLALLVLVYQLTGSIARAEIIRLDTVDTQYGKRVENVETRLSQLEGMHTDLAVLKTNVEWIRKELEARKQAGYPANEPAHSK